MHPIIPLLQLLNVLGRIEGRKRLQKMVHILQEMGAGFQERFQYSFYGMYSLQLKSQIDMLKADELVTETFSGLHYVISRDEKLSQLATDFGFSEEPDWAHLARLLNHLSPMELEGISTIFFLRHTENNEDVVRQRLLTLKPHLETLAEKCFEQANILKAEMPVRR